MNNSENSALMALSELKNLEADRVRQEEDARRAAEEAERRAREEAERIAREEAERRAAAEAARLEAERVAREEREREERLRIQEAEARARAEQEARLKEEQMRLDAQVKLSEEKAKPKWPLVVVPMLVLGLGFAGFMVWKSQQEAEARAAEKAAADAQHAADMKKFQERFDQLEAEQKRMADERAAVDKEIGASKGDEKK